MRECDRGWRVHPDGTADGPATRLGFKPGMVIQELGWDNDTDDDLRVAIEDCIDADMVDGDYGNVVDAVLLWWREEDGDLVDGLVDALTDLVGGGAIWLLTPKVGRPNSCRRRRHRRGRADRGAGTDHDGGCQQGLAGHPTGRAQDARLTLGLRTGGRRRSPEDPIRASPRPCPVPQVRRAGVVRPHVPPGAGRRSAGTIKAWGTGPAGGFAQLAISRPHQVGLIDELGELTFAEMHTRVQRPGPRPGRARGERGRPGGDHVPQPPRLRRRHRRGRQARRGPALPQHRLRGPQLVDVIAREKPAWSSTTRSSPSCSALAEVGERLLAWTDTPDHPDTIETLIRQVPHQRPDPARAPRRVGDPDLGTTGTPKGAPRKEAGIEQRRGTAVADAAQGRLAHPHRRAALPHLGLRAPVPRRCCSARRWCCGASSTPRTRSGPSASTTATRSS